jgi:hypothetical protein
LLLLTIATFFITIILVPIMVFFSQVQTLIAAAIIGLFFGFIISHIITDLEHLEQKHHIFLGIFIPIVAVLNIFLMESLSSRAAAILKITIQQDPYVISIVYLIALMMPYLFNKFRQHSA